MKRTFAGIGLLMLMALQPSAQEVETDRDQAFDFSQLQTFAVKIGTPWGDPSSEAATRQAFIKRLSEKGWKQTDEASCDALVVLHGARQGKQTFRAFYEGWLGYGWHNVGAPALADTTDYDYKPGALVVDIFETKTRKAVFRGVAQDLTGKSANDVQKLGRAAKKMLQNLPTGKGEGKSGAASQEPGAPQF
jgi:uncharacterized protein DUF4136